MGQQQLLLIILGVIVVGIAVAVGITMFQDNAVSANRDAVVNDLVNLAARAQQFYRRPTSLGGGQNSFAGLSGTGGISKLVNVPTSATSWVNANGTYQIQSAIDSFVIVTGLGNEIGNDGGQKVKVTMTVRATSTVTTVDN
jgi:Tfp pilus assembly protein PilE